MLTHVEVSSPQGLTLNLSMQTPANGYVIQEINGLDPVKATVVSSTFANLDGEQFQSSRRATRNITLRLGLSPDYSVTDVESLRRYLYNFFMPKSSVSLRFIMHDALELDISGVVESLETALFSEDPAVDISVICFDPDFTVATPVVISGATVTGSTEITVEYAGSSPTGILFEMLVDRTLSEFTIYHRGPDNVTKSMNVTVPFVNTDDVTISTVAGDKRATMIHSSSLTSILYGVAPQSTWIELAPGTNYIRVVATGAPINYMATYTRRYGGV